MHESCSIVSSPKVQHEAIQTRFSQIQEQPWNSNSAFWKTVHKLIFNWKIYITELDFFDQKWIPVKNVEFENSPWYWPSKKVVNFQILHFWLKAIFDQQFQHGDEYWVGKMPNIVIFGDRTQIIPNWTKLFEKNRI